MKTHGMSKTPTYIRWKQIIQRCSNPKNKSYQNYGGRGINVCPEWRDFTKFLSDMGEAPEGMSLDREDNNEGYSKENCKWATKSEQALNTRKYRNNSSGRTGVSLIKATGKWLVRIRVDNVKIYGGVYNNFQEASNKASELELVHQGRVRQEISSEKET